VQEYATPDHQFSFSLVPRGRSNVLDLLKFFGRGALPHYLFSDIDMSFEEGLREVLLAQKHIVTVTAILLKAIGLAQRKHPLSRTILSFFGRTSTIETVSAGITIERNFEGKPTVFFGLIEDPDYKPIEKIAEELKNYASADIEELPTLKRQCQLIRAPGIVRQTVFILANCFPSFRLKCMSSTFGLSSLGKYNVESLIGPCVCTCTFGIGTIEERAVAVDGQALVKPMMTLSLGIDERVMSGIQGQNLLDEVRKLMEGELRNFLPGEYAKTEQKLGLCEPLTLEGLDGA
jgi:hypothetical protein